MTTDQYVYKVDDYDPNHMAQSAQEIKDILLHLYRCPEFLDHAKTQIIDLSLFDTSPDLAIMYEILLAHHNMFGKHPTMAAHRNELMAHIAQESLDESTSTRLYGLEEYMFRTEASYLSPDYYKEVLMGKIQMHAIAQTQKRIGSHAPDDVGGIQESLAESVVDMHTNPFSSANIVSPVDGLRESLINLSRCPTHIPWLDKLLSGGYRPGESIGILACTGGGKTTLGLQIIASMVQHQEHGVYFTAEQGLKGDMAHRCAVLCSGEPRKVFEGDNGWDDVPKNVQDVVEAQRPAWRKYFHMVDLVSGGMDKEITGVHDIINPLQKLLNEGMPPTIVVLDWWGVLFDQFIANCPNVYDSAEKRRMSRKMIKQLTTFAQATGYSFVILHQVAPAAAKVNVVPSAEDAQEDKQWGQLFNTMIGFSKLYQNRCLSGLGKSRSSQASQVNLYLNGPLCRFVHTDDPVASAETSDYISPDLGDDDLDDMPYGGI